MPRRREIARAADNEPEKARGRDLCLVQGLAYLAIASDHNTIARREKNREAASRGFRKPNWAIKMERPSEIRIKPRKK